jgi:hypothetical protein
MKEDVRETLPVKGNFYDVIYSLFEKNETANILYDDHGITRANGKIKEVSERNDAPFFVLENGLKINIHSIIAVNGIFASDYSEC